MTTEAEVLRQIDAIPSIHVGSFMSYVWKYVPNKDIDHHGLGCGLEDLYLRVTPITTALVAKLNTKSLLSKFIDNREGDHWYELPFLYSDEKEEW